MFRFFKIQRYARPDQRYHHFDYILSVFYDAQFLVKRVLRPDQDFPQRQRQDLNLGITCVKMD